MKPIYHLCFLLLFSFFTLQAQEHVNGELDAIEDLSTVITVPLQMPDGTNLMTDIYLPITSDSMVLDVDFGGIPLTLELIPKGTQLMFYDSLNNEPNPNPYQLPFVFTRSPYNKQNDLVGYVVNILGYGYALQDMRGRYSSEGVYFPMLSDSWSKAPYHPNFSHNADITDLSDITNSNQHEDGYNSIEALLELTHDFDLDGDGIAETNDWLTNGSVGMFGASALGNTQLQAASVRPINPDEPGLKCLLPVVATNEHFNSTGYNNGVFRESLVTGWVKGQVYDMNDGDIPNDNSLNNSLHTAADYNMTDKFEVAERCIDHLTSWQYNGEVSSAYPNSSMRTEMDASHAPVNEMGLGDANGTVSRYTNLEVPMMHLTGWWDIFINGQIETHRRVVDNISPENAQLQKLIIGPYAHQTIGSSTTGDMTYPDNAIDIINADLSDLDLSNLDLEKFLKSEVISWYRYNLNEKQGLPEPKIKIPSGTKWQDAGVLGTVRIPAEDYIITLNDLLGFLAGIDDLPIIPVELINLNGDAVIIDIDLANFDIDLGDIGFNTNEIPEIPTLDYSTVPAVRFYVVGPVDDGVAENENLGNRWMSANHFPLTEEDGIVNNLLYFQNDGSMRFEPPTEEEGSQSYVHNPNNPVLSIGGANMIVKTPDGRDSQGQFVLNNPEYESSTLNHPGVIAFETDVIEDSLTLIGFPKARIFASSMPAGAEGGDPTDTDFFVRLVDVYPNGNEFFVQEGAINARARNYARSIANGNEDSNIPYSNIDAGEIYEYEFEMLPIAYSWGKGHKLKVLISSSNYDRYQVNPNLPIEDGEFFRRQPNDGQTYNFNGEDMASRIAEQTIYFSSEYPSYIELPLLNQNIYTSTPALSQLTNDVQLYPNPASDVLFVNTSEGKVKTLTVYDVAGKLVQSFNQMPSTGISITNWAKGAYLVTIELENGATINRKMVKQ